MKIYDILNFFPANYLNSRRTINALTLKNPKHKFYNINCSGFTIAELLVALFILAIISSMVEYGPAPPRTTPQEENIKMIKKSIDQYYADRGRYPKNLIDLTQTAHPYFSEIPIDPLTGTADWEVSEYKNKKIWYRTTDDNYPNAPAKWTPGPESYVFDIRPRQQKYQLVEE